MFYFLLLLLLLLLRFWLLSLYSVLLYACVKTENCRTLVPGWVELRL